MVLKQLSQLYKLGNISFQNLFLSILEKTKILPNTILPTTSLKNSHTYNSPWTLSYHLYHHIYLYFFPFF